ncbi:potential histone binding protein [Pseudozyma hubeiensis SY62]|uniref:Potential histone binding protein n=1 Tax=Pseudozyma hubeiensis (strain SY62) TaxID=1305764 RepID=R9NZ85_PSEHS|nr:potential histone binding protein [Pseudozyma hubeiensis SY62]GAC94056.1 potential histone binding protein [Pseudozyma hubeiensis SY62]
MALNEQPSNPQPDVEASAEAADGASARQLIDEAKRHFALKEYVAASDKLALALDALSTEYAEDADELAPLLQLYGQSVLENFIINSGALGGGGGSAPLPAAAAPAAPAASGSSSKASGSSSSANAVKSDPRFSFTGDAEDDGDDDEEEGAPGAGAAEGDDEDDLQTAFSVLDLARVIYRRALDSESQKLTTLEGQEWGKTRIQAELAEVMNLLGDVGLESENFTQASADYQSSLDTLRPLLNPHSRRLADAHLRLGLALEFHPEVEQRRGAKAHVQAASDVLAARIAAIQARIDSATTSTTSSSADTGTEKEKDDLADLHDQAALEKELADVQQLKKELDTKLEEYETEDGQAQLNGQPDLTGVLGLPADAAAAAAGMSTKDALQQAIKDAFLGAQAEGGGEVNPFTGGAKGAAAADAPVNNLSSMVKRKKKPEADDAGDASAAGQNGETEAKKAKTEA